MNIDAWEVAPHTYLLPIGWTIQPTLPEFRRNALARGVLRMKGLRLPPLK
jgi:hypothetical protein